MHLVTDEIIKQIKYVKVDRVGTSLEYFPNFLIVGPQRTGTTWLVDNLAQHPQIFMSRTKELMFFNNLTRPRSKLYHSNRLDWYLSNFRDSPVSWIRKQYASLTHYGYPYSPVLRGEATASYSVLNEDIINDIVTLNPDIKIIMMLRNPIDRAWSHAKKDLLKRKKRNIKQVSDDEFISFFQSKYQIQCASYTSNIKRWRHMVRPGHVYIGNFDEIHENPTRLLTSIYEWLGLRAEQNLVPSTATKQINSTLQLEIPVRLRRILAAMFSEEMKRINTAYNYSWE